MDRASPDTKIAEMVVETEELCSICKEEADPSNAINLAVSGANCRSCLHCVVYCVVS